MSPPSYERSFEDETSDVNLNDPATEEEEEIYQKGVTDDDWSELEAKPRVGVLRNFTDCSNVFKAFIGSALIGLPFAVLQAGIVLAIVCIFLIAVATDHCCGLIVKCKRIVIAKIIQEKIANGEDKEEIRKHEELLGRTLSFGRIGKACLGKPGLLAVNISVMVTQFGFTIGYFIFMGNTLRTIIRYFVVHNMTTNGTIIPTKIITTTKLLTTTLTTTTAKIATSNASFLLTSPLVTAFPEVHNGTILQMLHHHVTQAVYKVVKDPLNAHNLMSNSAITFALLILMPLPILIGISFIRNLRKLGPISVVANASITSAFACTIIYIGAKMTGLPDNIALIKQKTFPIFFGQVTGAFEGIGTVIPIEGSMAENRPRYPCFLHVSLFFLSFILLVFGIVGYLAYGDNTCQIVTANLHGPVAIALQILLFFGVLFTYPLQIYPCIQITERIFIKFRQWRMMKARKYKTLLTTNGKDEEENLIENDERPPEIKAIKLKKWEGNIIRITLVTLTAGIALLFRAQFAYISALTGSIGSSLLSYILPPIFHISLRKHKMPRWVIIKDVCLVLFGIVGGLMGFIVTIQEIVESFGKGHPKHC